MKKIVLIATFLALIAPPCLAGDTFTLTTPMTVMPQAYGGEITNFEWIPGPGGRLIIHFLWTDNTGKGIVSKSVEWEGSDYADIFGFVIRAQDAGMTLEDGLKTLIYSKIETKYNVVIE